MGLEQDKIDEALGDLKKLVGRNTGEFFLNGTFPSLISAWLNNFELCLFSGWLHVSRVRVDDRAEHYYEWGPRATTCVDPMVSVFLLLKRRIFLKWFTRPKYHTNNCFNNSYVL